MVNRTQTLVLGFFAIAWLSIVVLLLSEPDVYDAALRLPHDEPLLRIGLLVVLSCLIAFLGVGVVRRWRWTFWLVFVAFIAGIARVPVSVLELTGVVHAELPHWYIGFQGALGVVQLVIAILMAVGCRKAGPWGAF